MTHPPFNCSRCPDKAAHKALVDGPVAEFAREHGEKDEKVLAFLEAEDACDCCGIYRGVLLPFHHDAHDDSGDSWDYCQECFDAGCSVNDPTGGCVL